MVAPTATDQNAEPKITPIGTKHIEERREQLRRLIGKDGLKSEESDGRSVPEGVDWRAGYRRYLLEKSLSQARDLRSMREEGEAMIAFQVDDCPEQLYEELCRCAEEQGRSVSRQIVHVLRRYLRWYNAVGKYEMQRADAGNATFAD